MEGLHTAVCFAGFQSYVIRSSRILYGKKVVGVQRTGRFKLDADLQCQLLRKEATVELRSLSLLTLVH